jgi:chemotaxis protein MotB
MAKSCQCKKAAGECEECPEWIFTFADLVMLMMGFFVILWVLKPSPSKDNPQANTDWIKVAAAIRDAFNYVPDPQSKDPVDIEMLLEKLQKMKIAGPGDGGKTDLRPDGPQGTDPEVTSIRASLAAAEGGKLLYAPGSAELTDAIKPVLGQIADIIRGHRTVVFVKGHTALDDLPPDATAKQRMDLSINRAQVAADYLIAKGVDPEIIRVQGCSTFEPVVSHVYTTNSQAQNRRVEVVASSTLVDELKDRPATTKPTIEEPAPATQPKPAAATAGL